MEEFFKTVYSGKKLTQALLICHQTRSYPEEKLMFPYVFLGDGAFALHKHIMKPFPGNHNFNTMERTFNHKLSSSRVIVENVFGILTTIFRIFRKPIEIDIENVPTVTMTCILLHN
ncbi:hypothetical protein PYW08_009152 [Mythimna loreyi]|uniref:Uncharacterized protein n=1 Tax=Mythimna loreyi TaxID=667449 RepID=A0ACC2QCN9_9NEOP|nr:hypothetical protein PYW08_009152 [Mythimna loreyi]